jgi:Do/DeqQ family serine protease
MKMRIWLWGAIASALLFSAASLTDWAPRAQDAAPDKVPETKSEITLSFSPVVKRIAPAVVNVYGARVEQRARDPFFDDPVFSEFFGGRRRERVQQSVGSGVVIAADGLVVTNHHVIKDMTEVKVALADKREFSADIILRDPRTDLAVLKLRDAKGLTFAEFGNSDGLEVGDLVLAIGNPFGVGQTVTQGIVSALARTRVGVSDYQFFIQTDAAINPGNSGGALVDVQGRLIGINTAIYSRTGGNQGIGFAIPTTMVRQVVEQAQGGNATVRRPWFGASLQSVTSDIAESLQLERPTGALIAKIAKDSPADKSGLKRGDIILEVDGNPIDDPDGFGYRFATKGISGSIAMSVMRGSEKRTVNVALQPAPETPQRDLRRLRGRIPLGGATIANLSPAVSEELSIENAGDGVVVFEITPNSPAARLQFQKGDIILELNGEAIASTEQLEALSKQPADFWRLAIQRGDRVVNLSFGG